MLNCFPLSLTAAVLKHGELTSSQFHQHFYVQIFRTNVVSAAFSSYVLALSKNSYEKFARFTLMKLTPGGKTSYSFTR